MSDTIAAVGTGDKKSAIGIVRMSGDRAADILERVFRPKHGSVSGMKAGRLYYGELLDAFGEVIDLCLATVSRAPKSYTGEAMKMFSSVTGSPASSVISRRKAP